MKKKRKQKKRKPEKKEKVKKSKEKKGPVRELNPGPLAPEARIIPLDQQAKTPTIGAKHNI